MATYKMINPREFSVIQYFKDGTYEKVREFVDAEEATTTFAHYINNVAAKIGLTVRVIVTDGGDCINMEWKRYEGITFPKSENDPELKKIVRDYHSEEDGE
jgi:hypothetical protein